MNKIKPIHCVIGSLAFVILVSLLIPRAGRGPSEESDPNFHPIAEQRDVQQGPILRQSVARGSANVALKSEVPAEAATPKSRYEQLLTSLKDIGVSAQPDFEQIKALLKIDPGELGSVERAEILGRAAQLIVERNLDQGLELVAALDNFQDRHGLVKMIVETVVAQNPSRAAEWASRLPEAALRQSAHNEIGMKWGQVDIGACRAWAEQVSDGLNRQSALEGLTWAWTLQDSDAAFEWAAHLPESETRDAVFVKMSKLVTAQDPQRGSEWALTFPAGPGRAAALDYAVFQWASQDLERAAVWAARIEEQALRESGFGAVERSWSNRDPEKATAWAVQLPEGEARTAALITTTRKWAESNPAAAAQWMGQLAEAPARDEIFRSVTSTLATTQPSAVEAWLNGVKNPKLRAVGEQVIASQQEHPHQPGHSETVK